MKRTILIVDDLPLNREILTEILESDYVLLEAEDGNEALSILENKDISIDVVLLDILMPNLDGFGVLKGMKEHNLLEKIPVLVISSEQSIKTEQKCFEYEIADFIRKPFDHNIVKKRVHNVAELYAYQRSLEERVDLQTKALKKQNKILLKQAEKLRQSNTEIIDILGTVVESRNLESGEHVQRVKGYTRILAFEMMKRHPEYGLTTEIIERIVAASALHDIGKICIPDNILLKPGKLDATEFDIMKQHTVKGCELLDVIRNKEIWDDDYDQASYEICRYHHERYDGRGYPDGLKEDEIPISAQLVSIADVYDALVNDRVYKKALPKDVAFNMIIEGQCGAFSPKLLECFVRVRPKFESLAEDLKKL